MSKLSITVGILLLFAIPTLAQAPWDYEKNGDDWTHSLCAPGAGSEQSPIDIDTDDLEDIEESKGMDISLDYINFSGANFNGGFVFFDMFYRVNPVSGQGTAGSIEVMNQDSQNSYVFEFESFHFHGDAEHTIDGKRYDLEMHIAHYQKTATLARYGADIVVLFEEGSENKFLKKMIDDSEVDWDELFGSDKLKNYVYYDGAETGFDCREILSYYIWTEIQEASQEQIDFIKGYRDAEGEKKDGFYPTYRNVQELNGRKVYQWGSLKDFEDFAGVLAAIASIMLFV